MTDQSLEAGVKALEGIAADVKARLRGEMADAMVQRAEADVVAKFRTAYQVDPPTALVRGRQRADVDAYDQKVLADLRAFQAAQDATRTKLETDADRFRELPDAVTDRASIKRSDLNLTEEMAVRADERARRSELQQALSGAGYDVALARYRQALAQNDRVALKYLEEQARAQWPGVKAGDLEAQLTLSKTIAAARNGRVPADLQEALTRVAQTWSPAFDGLARNLLTGRYPVAQVAFERHLEAAARRRHQAIA